MDVYLGMLEEVAEFQDLISDIKKQKTPINVLGVSDSVKAHLICCAVKRMQVSSLIVTQTMQEAKDLQQDLQFFLKEPVLFFPPADLVFYDVEAKSRQEEQVRLQVLRKIGESKAPVCVITTLQGALSPTLEKGVFLESCLKLKDGDTMEIEELSLKLTQMGYRREEMVEAPGQFSIRGGIVDIYPADDAYGLPIRIEFFDVEVDSIRLFDPENQRTVEKLSEFTVYAAYERLLTPKARESLMKKLDAEIEKLSGKDEREERLLSTLRRDRERLSQHIPFASVDKYLPMLSKKPTVLLDYFEENTLVFLDEPTRLSECAKGDGEQEAQMLFDLTERGVLYDGKGIFSLPYADLLKKANGLCAVGMSGIAHGSSALHAVSTHRFQAQSMNSFQGRLDFLVDSLQFYQKNLYRTVLLAGSAARAENLMRQLADEGIRCAYQEQLTKMPNPGGVVVCGGSLRRGFSYAQIRLAVIGDREIFGAEKKKKRRYQGKKEDRISHFSQLQPGDFVVHQNHGIGLYAGIEQLTVDGVHKDYLKIQYRGTDVLYVPTDQLNMVYKHTAGDGKQVKLNKLGGAEWTNTKKRVKAAAADMAKKLIALYASRTKSAGISFDKDTEWQRDFEAAFPYEETEDQLRSIQEVKLDMEKPHPMERLLCGDVGYGKTEVAMRAAFKAVMSGYQVAYLVPTTILASQHFNNFKQRMLAYPMGIEMLSRFTPASHQKEVLKGLKSGEVDIVIGTHKLLGKQVEFHKLGLLVIDEEQRFGVAHKERLKEMKKDVDVLTLSATPIPRTLHMSLSGIRDMSVLNEPPAERHPVTTYVMEYDENVVCEAILKELGRGGQVYYLYNRVEGIYKVANRLKEQLPQARIAVAHGKMNEKELEEIMMAMAEHEVDVLVCTTIIETGLDIANVNTIIIENADRLGLAQLYQLRGRVGRSNRLAYAYLTFRRNKMLTREAEKRLFAIKEFTEFGSGFKIAMRDLEIRGTGNLIGAEQSGHLEAVGYEMYCMLLEQAVREENGAEERKETQALMDLPVSAYIPKDYIPNHNQRIGAYKRIAAISNQEELYDTYDEMEDRYGTVPQVVYHLMEVAKLKQTAQRVGICEILGNNLQVTFTFDEENLPDLSRLVAEMQLRPKELYLPNPNKPKVYLRLPRPKPGEEKAYFEKLNQVVSLFELPEECERNVNNEENFEKNEKSTGNLTASDV